MATHKNTPPIRILGEDDVHPAESISPILDSVILGDAFEVLGRLPAESVDSVFFDPPYYLQLSGRKLRRWNVKTEVNGVSEQWDSFSSWDEYDTFIAKALQLIRHTMKPNATLWAIGTYHNIFRIGKIMQDLGFWTLNDVIWVKTNPMPNWLGVRFTNATETLIWAVKDKGAKDYAFDRDAARRFGIGKVGANVWVLPICSRRERVLGDDGKKLHPTQKPIELLRRVILTSTIENAVVLDPMAGVGTTGYVAAALGRHFIMIENDERYVAGIASRFRETPPSPQALDILRTSTSVGGPDGDYLRG